MHEDAGNGRCEAPALTRGLALLRLLSRDGALTLDRIARSTGWPKPSLLRLLRTLANDGAAARDPATGRWRATLRLAAIENEDLRLVNRCAQGVARLCREAGHVVEVYAWEDGRMVMIDRADPPHGEVLVRMRLGGIRDGSELDAVSVWGAALGGAARPRRIWEWNAGAKVAIGRSRWDEAVTAARSAGVACDRDPNGNLVRRFAAPVTGDGGQLLGVIALACAPMSAPSPHDARLLDLVLSAARLASNRS
jgi:DNA-binding IclR family transcriptional regulator